MPVHRRIPHPVPADPLGRIRGPGGDNLRANRRRADLDSDPNTYLCHSGLRGACKSECDSGDEYDTACFHAACSFL